MATKRFYATGDFRYGTRMLRAGDPVDMDGPTAKVFFALNKISANNPKKAPVSAAVTEGETVTITKPKRAPRKRAAKK